MKSTESEGELFFTMKVYATTSNGKIKTLKYSIDLNPPFDASTGSIKPLAPRIDKETNGIFDKIFDNVKELLRYIASPLEYNPKGKQSKGTRLQEQKDLTEAIRLSKGAINYITFEQNSPPVITVGALFTATGNGDMRPPKA
jgi:hypothetical protein